MNKREQIIKNYFQSWLEKNDVILAATFDTEIIYCECYGPEYQGLYSVKRWFKDWNKQGTVIEWDIKQFVHQASMTVVEWYFKCEYEGNIGEFDGVSMIEFNDDNYIICLKEFQSKIPHYYPYK